MGYEQTYKLVHYVGGKMKKIEFIGRVWHGDNGDLIDNFLDWIIKQRQSQDMWGKQCRVTIELNDPELEHDAPSDNDKIGREINKDYECMKCKGENVSMHGIHCKKNAE